MWRGAPHPTSTRRARPGTPTAGARVRQPAARARCGAAPRLAPFPFAVFAVFAAFAVCPLARFITFVCLFLFISIVLRGTHAFSPGGRAHAF